MGKPGINLLDDLQIKRLISAGNTAAISDGGGLTFTLSKAGTASFILRYRRNGKQKEVTLGNYPDLTLAAARKTARELRVTIDQGGDPAADKKLEKMRSKATWSILRLADDYIEKQLLPENYAEDTIYYRLWDLNNVIKPKLGSLDVQVITPPDIVYVLETTGRTWTINKRILVTMSKLFDHALAKRLISFNPCGGIKLSAIQGPRPPIKKRVMLSRDEIHTLLSAIDKIGRENSLALRILMVTCVRGSELLTAKWTDIDLIKKVWLVEDHSTKTRQGFLVPITPTVEAWFNELHSIAGGSAYVLPARHRTRKDKYGDTHAGRTTLWAAIERAFKRGDIPTRRFTPHDTRSTAKGHMRNLGITREVSELALNHKLVGMDSIYDVRTDIPERRHALEVWANFIDDIAKTI